MGLSWVKHLTGIAIAFYLRTLSGQPMAIATWLGTVVGTIVFVATLIYLLLSLFLLSECLVALRTPQSSAITESSTTTPAFSILMPAHNEAGGMEKTLKGLISEVDTPSQILVVADNCQDQTAAIAKATGVRVLERNDTTQRGKGYALDFGLKALAADNLDVVVMIDADCWVKPGTIHQIALQADQIQQPVQAVYVMEQPSEPGLRDRVSSFALIVKNQVRAAGLSRLGIPIMLGGTGMAFPWAALESVDLASGHIVEDMKLGMDLAIAGYRPQLSMATQVIALLPDDEAAAKNQRTRWEHGHLQVLKTYVPKLLSESLRQLRPDLFFLACDLAIPPLALWSILGTILTGITAMLALVGIMTIPFQTQLLADVVLLSTILLCWGGWGREALQFSQLLAIPLYVLWKIPIYIKAVLNPEKTWVRTKRNT
jgi:cellulose synthase/poly-beta-1,6-N-acetylglucosamine synthase-like glycosyltransferase